jgi:hypothetical protein
MSSVSTCRNLKAARELGMETIRELLNLRLFYRSDNLEISDVPLGGSLQAVKTLEEVLGMNLTRVEDDSAKL